MTFSEWLTTCETALTLHTTIMLRQKQVGAHRSSSIGKGLRLRHHEAYRPGDDRRFIDWKASRKDRTLLLRRFEAEKRLEVMVLCDVSTSMWFGRRLPKHRIALDCAGVLSLAALRQGEAFGLVAFANEVVAQFPPRQRREAVLQALEYLWNYTPSQAANTATLLVPVLQYLPVDRPLLVCLLSDFRMPDWQEGLDMLSAMHDIIAVVIEDEAETSLQALGRIVVRDLESGCMIELDTASPAYRQAYRERMLAARATREQLLQRLCGAQHIVASHATDYRGDLLRLFLARMTHIRV
jgi:uncharacterized protein (DUF58 family)